MSTNPRLSVDAAFDAFQQSIANRLNPDEELQLRRKNERLSQAHERVSQLAKTPGGAKAVIDALVRDDDDG